jgi:hypothetical protein
MKTWDELEVTKRSLNLGTAGKLDGLDEDVPPGAIVSGTFTATSGGRKETLLKDGTAEITTILTVDSVKVKSVKIPEGDPQLPLNGDVTTAGEAVDGVVQEIDRKRQAAGERADDDGDPFDLEDAMADIPEPDATSEGEESEAPADAEA